MIEHDAYDLALLMWSLSCHFVTDELKYYSNSIRCATSEQYEKVADYLMSEFCPNVAKVYFM